MEIKTIPNVKANRFEYKTAASALKNPKSPQTDAEKVIVYDIAKSMQR